MQKSDRIKHKQSQAVNRLLEVAEKHKLQEEQWQESEKKDILRSTRGHLSLPNKNVTYNKPKNINQAALRSQKQQEKQRLQQLIKDTILNQQDLTSKKKNQSKKDNVKEMNFTARFIRNTKLKPFNSNMTFHGMKQKQKQRCIASSLNFYKRQTASNFSQLNQSNSFRKIQNNEIEEQFYKNKMDLSPNKRIIYFKPNKSETVRQLLKQMRQEKSKDHQVVLNTTQKKFYSSYDLGQVSNDNVFTEQQLRVLSRYKKFVPFQKDQDLLWKKMLDGDNIWLQKFRQSWTKKKSDHAGRRSNFKKLIVNS